MIRTILSDEQWERIAPELPGKVGDPGATAGDNRLFLEAVLWIARTGVPWRGTQKQAIGKSRGGRTTKIAALVDALHAHGFEVGVESNGTLALPGGIDWVCVSPKAGTELKQRSGDELKLVYPQAGLDPADLECLAFAHRFLQPMDGTEVLRNTQASIAYCKAHPAWRLSLQTHKLLGIP